MRDVIAEEGLPTHVAAAPAEGVADSESARPPNR
jgi:hypothetical protein